MGYFILGFIFGALSSVAILLIEIDKDLEREMKKESEKENYTDNE